MTDLTKLSRAELLHKKLLAERLLASENAKDSLLSFVKFMMPDPNHPNDFNHSLYDVQPHHMVIAEALENIDAGRNLRMLLSVPPQHGKSLLASIMFPAWAIGRKPWRNFILATYSDDFAGKFGAKVRNLIQSPAYRQVFPNVKFQTGSKSKSQMVTEQGGQLLFSGLKGQVTGNPSDIFVFDDLLKGVMESASVTIRDQVWDFLWSVAYTRIHAGGAMIGIGTRWSEDDHIGRLTDKTNSYYDEAESKKWTYINLPAIIEDPELAKALDRKQGEVLWPVRYTHEYFNTVRKLSEYTFNALYMGRPTPPEGAFFKQWQLKTYSDIKQFPKNCRWYGSCDLAVSPDRDADSSVVINWGLDEEDTLWAHPDIYWEKKGSDESVEQLWKYGKQYQWMTMFGEKGQISRSIGPFLKKRMMEENAYFNIEEFPTINKGQAAKSIQARMAQGKVRYPAFAPWWPRAKEQLLKFTGSGDDKSDDFVDACSRAGQGLQMQVSASHKTEKLPDNVVPIGSGAWVYKQYQHHKREKKRMGARRAF